jgi:hypothetical protein
MELVGNNLLVYRHILMWTGVKNEIHDEPAGVKMTKSSQLLRVINRSRSMDNVNASSNQGAKGNIPVEELEKLARVITKGHLNLILNKLLKAGLIKRVRINARRSYYLADQLAIYNYFGTYLQKRTLVEGIDWKKELYALDKHAVGVVWRYLRQSIICGGVIMTQDGDSLDEILTDNLRRYKNMLLANKGNIKDFREKLFGYFEANYKIRHFEDQVNSVQDIMSDESNSELLLQQVENNKIETLSFRLTGDEIQDGAIQFQMREIFAVRKDRVQKWIAKKHKEMGYDEEV